MKNYTVTTFENLRRLCIEKGWFTCGTNEQYEKLFYANEHGATIDEIAMIIWVCSEDFSFTSIHDELFIEHLNYVALVDGE